MPWIKLRENLFLLPPESTELKAACRRAAEMRRQAAELRERIGKIRADCAETMRQALRTKQWLRADDVWGSHRESKTRH